MARDLYHISSSRVPSAFWANLLLVKEACCRCNLALGHLDASRAQAVLGALAWLRSPPQAGRLDALLDLDAWQGGAGTSMNMVVNEVVAALAREQSGLPVDPLADVNLHQSTNDVVPSALRLMLLDRLEALEPLVAALQTACQEKEQAWAGIPLMAHTQLQDALVMDAGKVAATWAGGLGRDRWRVFKGRERLKELNLGGTAIGSGAGAPRDYVLQVIRHLQNLCRHPVTRSEDLFDGTANTDTLVEAMESLNALAGNLNRIATDIRLLSSGPGSGMGLLKLPAWIKGSSIMAGKVNPVVAELALQVAWRVQANHALLSRTCGSGELQLNAFLPLILQTCHESLELLEGVLPVLARYVKALEPDRDACAASALGGPALNLVLLPLLGYPCVEALGRRARETGRSPLEELAATGLWPGELDTFVKSPRQALTQGYDPAVYRVLAETHRDALEGIRALFVPSGPGSPRPAGADGSGTTPGNKET